MLLYPYAYVDSVFSIDYRKLYEKGYRGLIFDIDNTLVHHGDDSTPEIDGLFRRLHELGFQTLLLSNNNEARVLRFKENIDCLYICDAEKPKPWGYLKAVEMMGIQKEEAILLGDQIFTDILGANRSGIASILVKFIRLPEETKFGKRRMVENMILKCYRRSRRYQNRFGDISRREEHENGAQKELL